MGICYSIFRNRKSRGEEREPLLPKYAPAVPPQSQFDKVADILAALSEGKYPSQDQINSILRMLLYSDVLTVENGPRSGPLSVSGQKVLTDLRQILQAFIRLGMEKNADDKLQDMMWHLRQMEEIPVRTNVDTETTTNLDVKIALEEGASHVDTPHRPEVSSDIRKAASSILTLLSLLVTSKAFRLILSDILVMSRDILADIAVDIAKVAAAVETRAEQVEEAIRTTGEDTSEGQQELPSLDNLAKEAENVKQLAEETTEDTKEKAEKKKNDIWKRFGDKSPERIKQTVLRRISMIIEQAQSSPQYTAALISLAALVRKYIERLASTAQTLGEATEASTSQAPAPVSLDSSLEADPHLAQAIKDAEVIIERFSGRDIGRLGDKIKVFLQNIGSDEKQNVNGIPAFIDAATGWLNRSLLQIGWMATEEGQKEGSELYDWLTEILKRDPKYKADARAVFEEVYALQESLAQDTATNQLIDAVQMLLTDLSSMGRVGVQLATAESKRKWEAAKAELRHDVVGWVLPRVLLALKMIPLPRVELKSEKVDLVVDKASLSSPSFVPDRVKVTNHTEFSLRASDATRDRHFETSTRTQTHVLIKGLRISVEDIAYYVNAKGPLYTSWMDNGLLTVDVGGKKVEGSGVSLVLNIEVPSQESGEPNGDIFRILDVKVDVPGLAFTINHSRHWIINAMAQPFLGPFVRAGVAFYFYSQIRGELESLNSYLCALRAKAKLLHGDDQTAPAWGDWWNAIKQYNTTSVTDISRGSPAPAEDVHTHTEIETTTKGIIRTTITENAEGDRQSETVLAVGVGEQVLPGVGGPQVKTTSTTAEPGQEAFDKIDDVRKKAKEEAHIAGQEATDASETTKSRLASAGERMKKKKARYAEQGDWRSDAFSF